jgi:alkylation response protein AidB-like acyl-CoA dehydrogenase
MRFLRTDEQRAIADTVRETLVKECSPEILRAAWGAGAPARLWKALADLGLFGLTIAEGLGGLGLDELDAVGALEETGRAAAPGPIAETFAAAYVLQHANSPEFARAWLPRIACGEAVVTLGLDASPYIESADRADVLLMQRGSELHALRADEVRSERQPSIDGNRRLFTVEWEPSASSTLVSGAEAEAVVAGARDRLLLALSSQLVGLSRQLLDLSVRHVAIREQFGRPLGTFQAVQHRLADVAVAVEFAAPVVARASCSLVAGAPSASRDVAMAKVFASEAAERAAYSSLQVHGAIGYTREHDLHLYSMRAWTLALAHGDASTHRARVAADLFYGEPAPRFP